MRTCDFLCMHARVFVYACVCLCLSESLLFGARVHLASVSCLYCDYVCLFCSGVSYPITLTMRTAAAQLSTDYAAFTAEAVADVPLDDLRRALDESDDSDDERVSRGAATVKSTSAMTMTTTTTPKLTILFYPLLPPLKTLGLWRVITAVAPTKIFVTIKCDVVHGMLCSARQCCLY